MIHAAPPLYRRFREPFLEKRTEITKNNTKIKNEINQCVLWEWKRILSQNELERVIAERKVLSGFSLTIDGVNEDEMK